MSVNRVVALGLALFPPLSAGAAAEELTVAAHGQSNCQIIISNDKNAAVDYAAAELQHFLQEISGAELPVVTEQQAGSGPAFLLGPGGKAAKTGLAEQAGKLGDDGVLIQTVDKDIVLLGGSDRGQLYSVYVLLEHFLGCRFLSHDCSVVPKQDVLTLPKIEYSYTPPFVYREVLCYDAARWEFAARQRLNGSNMSQCLGQPPPGAAEKAKGILIYPFVHTSAGMIPPDKYFASHPEYFGLVKGQRHAAVIGGQLCFTNPDVLRICTDHVLEWLAQHPDVTSVDVSQNDAYPGSSGACECEKCAAIVKEEGAQHGPILRFVNTIADVVAEKYPGKYVDTLAYDYTIATPRITKPRDNVIIRLCHYACYFHGIEGEALSANFRAAIDDWRKVTKNLFIWHYGTNFWSYLAPNPNLGSLARDIKYYAAHGVTGVMMQSDIQSPGGELAELRQYLAAQLMWDPTQDPMAIRADFCKGYYGPAAGEALEFLSLMDKLGETCEKHIPTNGWKPPEITTGEFVSGGLAILNRAYAKAGDAIHRNRVEKLLLPLWYMQLAWPDQYGLSKADGRAVLTRFKNVLKVNEITTLSEGPPNAKEFIARMESVYGVSDARTQWWREARFGLFIHWGVYSQLGRGEWVQFNEKIPVREYEKLAGTFNPVRFNAEEWVGLAEQAGCKYIVITAKHHDGFSMFRTKVSPFNIVDATPFKRDPMAELAEACKRHGRRLCFYYSHVREWRHPLAQSFENGSNYGNSWDYPDESKKNLNRYVDEFDKPQLKELLTQHGPTGLIWFDTPSFLSAEKSKECVDFVRALQPDCLVNSRVGGGPDAGWDYVSMGDCEVPPAGLGTDWEAPMTGCDSWGYSSDTGNRYRTPKELIHLLVNCASMGGNLLLNVGPTGEGVIPPQAAGPLEAVGRWMKTNGESIYGTQASPFKRLAWGRSTQKPGKLYLHVFNWPGNELVVPGLRNKIEKAYLLSDGEQKPLAVSQTEEVATVKLPAQTSDEIDAVVVLSITGPADVAPYALCQQPDGSVVLPAIDATINGQTARYESDKDCIGYWTNSRDWLSWEFLVKTPSAFEVQIIYACENASAGSEFTVDIAGHKLTGNVAGTGGWDKFVTIKLGTVRIDAAGSQILAIRSVAMPRGAVMNVRAVLLKPV